MKPNSIGRIGAIIVMISSVLVILIAILIMLLLGFTYETSEMVFNPDLGYWGEWETIYSTHISWLTIIFLIIAIASAVVIWMCITFMQTGRFKILLGILAIVFLFSSLIGLIGGILILASSPEDA